MITPEQVKNLSTQRDKDRTEIIQDIDESVKKTHGIYPLYEVATIDYWVDYRRFFKIAVEYAKAGWNYVYWNTGFQTNPSGAEEKITTIYLSERPIQDIRDVYCVTMRDGKYTSDYLE